MLKDRVMTRAIALRTREVKCLGNIHQLMFKDDYALGSKSEDKLRVWESQGEKKIKG